MKEEKDRSRTDGSENKRRAGGKAWGLPLLYALPFAAAMAAAALRWGGEIRRILSALIKLAVRA